MATKKQKRKEKRAQKKAAKTQKKAAKKVVRKEKKTARKEKRKAKGGIFKRVGRAAKKVYGNAALIPLAIPMAAFLKMKGLPVNIEPLENAKTIYHQVVKKTSSFEEVEPVTVSIIITAVVSFFRNIAKKKRDGEISEDDPMYQIGDAVDKVEIEIEDAAREEVHSNIGEFISDNLMFILIGAGILAFILLRKK